MAGGGGRYRHMFSQQFSVDLNVMAMLSAGQEWRTSQYNYSVLPLVLLGSNYHFEHGITAGTSLTLAPRDTSFDATGGFGIIFTTLQFSFPIAWP